MATTYGNSPGDSRRGVSSPRPKGREAKNTFCRNVTIYGHCRYENTCLYVHDPAKLNNPQMQNENIKKRFNVDSPSFTPLQPATNGALTPAPRSAAISPKAANAAVFTPKSQRSNTNTPSLHTKEPSVEWAPQDFPEFVPQSFDGQMVDTSTAAPVLSYDPFNTSGAIQTLPGSSHQAATLNPYVQDPTAALTGATFYQNANTFQTSPSYHLYWPIGPQPSNLLAYQRTAHDFFIPESLREDLQRKSEVTRQILPNSSLPPLEQYHSLVCLDTTQQKNMSLFGYQSWVYKAVSSKDGHTYALRRLEGFRLTNENAIRTVQHWKRVYNGSVVTIHDAFTTRAFGDSSLIIVTDYHPCSKSLAEEHFKSTPITRFHGSRQAASSHIPEQVLWGYIVQIASALKTIHSTGLAARLITPSKILITSKNRIRLNACAILDVVHYDAARSVTELQTDDLTQLGRLILCIANNNPNAHLSMQKSLDHIARSYTARLKDCMHWLLAPSPNTPGSPTSPTTPAPISKDIDAFLGGITDQLATVLDNTLHAEDTLLSTLARELESSRLVRLLVKLNFINERPELDASVPNAASGANAWSETGERYYLKLFRDYVFHQVDAQGHPVVDLAHVLACLNKLDAGSEERISLVSRDEQNVFVVSYRELKRGVEGTFQDLIKAGRAGR
ncbi:PAB-dependent poly(A)-specific ribonuclease subunit PAN3 [Glonium stellatum]|uniref:PAN2-PAN3 deadenylation complex subunit PAN3 n=1 Tax=Glonium stellatum TaxID=574774 RepID=A0A8E2F4A3_9PEZI|nr:PAB-dependent poly(A)-specific ribonuclease subunit PAN3 [Glonium stellatum]